MAGRKSHIQGSEAFEQFIQSIPEGSRGRGYWHIKREGIGNNGGGVMQSIMGWLEFNPGEEYDTLRGRIKESFAEKKGPGVYFAVPCDQDRKPIKNVDKARFEFKESEVEMPEAQTPESTPLGDTLKTVKKMSSDMAALQSLDLQQKILNKYLGTDKDKKEEDSVKEAAAGQPNSMNDFLMWKMLMDDGGKKKDHAVAAPEGASSTLQQQLLDSKLQLAMAEMKSMIAQAQPKEDRTEKLLKKLFGPVLLGLGLSNHALHLGHCQLELAIEELLLDGRGGGLRGSSSMVLLLPAIVHEHLPHEEVVHGVGLASGGFFHGVLLLLVLVGTEILIEDFLLEVKTLKSGHVRRHLLDGLQSVAQGVALRRLGFRHLDLALFEFEPSLIYVLDGFPVLIARHGEIDARALLLGKRLFNPATKGIVFFARIKFKPSHDALHYAAAVIAYPLSFYVPIPPSAGALRDRLDKLLKGFRSLDMTLSASHGIIYTSTLFNCPGLLWSHKICPLTLFHRRHESSWFWTCFW